MQLLGATAVSPAISTDEYCFPLPRALVFKGLSDFLNAPEALVAAALRRLEPHVNAAGILCWEAGSRVLTLVSSRAVRKDLSVSVRGRSAATGTRFVGIACPGSVGAVTSGGATFGMTGECDLGAALVGLYRSRFAQLGVVATGAGAALPYRLALNV